MTLDKADDNKTDVYIRGKQRYDGFSFPVLKMLQADVEIISVILRIEKKGVYFAAVDNTREMGVTTIYHFVEEAAEIK